MSKAHIHVSTVRIKTKLAEMLADRRPYSNEPDYRVWKSTVYYFRKEL